MGERGDIAGAGEALRPFGFVESDGGAASAGWTGKRRGDCVTRALALVTRPDGYDEGVWYQHCYDALAEATANSKVGSSKKSGRRTAVGGVSRKVSRPVYEAFGLVKAKLPAGPRPTFAEAHAVYGRCAVGTRGHIACVVDGALHDTADCRTYEWEVTDEAAENYGEMETRDRKAQSVWVPVGQPPMPSPECIARVSRRRAKRSGETGR